MTIVCHCELLTNWQLAFANKMILAYANRMCNTLFSIFLRINFINDDRNFGEISYIIKKT